MTKASRFFEKRAARAKGGTSLMDILANAPDAAAENEAWISRRRPITQDRLDKARALLHREGGLPPAPGDEIPESHKTREREQARKGRRKAS